MPKLLKIVQLGNPILLRRAREVGDVLTPDIQNLIDNMIHTCKKAKGFGLAAPQVGEPLRIFILASKPNSRYPDAPKMKPMAIINPVILSTSIQKEENWEGCLSIPGVRGLVPRHDWIRVRFLNQSGEQEERRLYDFVARVFQHEIDYLNGILFLSRTVIKDLFTENEYRKIIRRSKRVRVA